MTTVPALSSQSCISISTTLNDGINSSSLSTIKKLTKYSCFNAVLVSSSTTKLKACPFCVRFVLLVVCLCGEQDSNMRDLFGSRFLIQRGCTYDKVEYRTAVLPGCSAAADPVFTYPVALSCHCGACRTDSDECAHRASVDGPGCSKPVRRLYPYSDLRDYMIPS